MPKVRFDRNDFLDFVDDAAAAMTPINSSTSKTNKNPETEYDLLVDKYAEEHGVDPDLVKSIIHVESKGKQSAKSEKGATGRMQLMPDTAAEQDVDAEDPEENIKGGVKYIAKLLKRYDYDAEHALAAYHGGAARYDHRGKDLTKMGPRTRDYVPKVMDVYRSRKSSGMD